MLVEAIVRRSMISCAKGLYAPASKLMSMLAALNMPSFVSAVLCVIDTSPGFEKNFICSLCERLKFTAFPETSDAAQIWQTKSVLPQRLFVLGIEESVLFMKIFSSAIPNAAERFCVRWCGQCVGVKIVIASFSKWQSAPSASFCGVELRR